MAGEQAIRNRTREGNRKTHYGIFHISGANIMDIDTGLVAVEAFSAFGESPTVASGALVISGNIAEGPIAGDAITIIGVDGLSGTWIARGW